MPDLPVYNRDEWRQFLTRNASNYSQGDIDVGENGGPYVLLSTVADALAIQSEAARLSARKVALEYMSEAEVESEYGQVVPKQTDTGARGSITLECATTGTTLYTGDELQHGDTKNRYAVSLATSPTAFVNGDRVPVVSLDPGAGQNLQAGAVLTWSSPRAGCYASAVVYQQPSGLGLSGGRNAESLDEWKQRIRAHKANPAGHANEGDILTLAEDVSGRILPTGERTAGHGVPVMRAFAYPAVLGCGTCSLTFVVKQDNWWGSRCPTSTELTTVLAYVAASMPKDSILPVVASDLTLSIDVTISLNPQSAQWADFAPWPRSATRGAGRKVIGTVTSSTAFQIVTDDGDYTAETTPTVGQTIGLFDYTTGTFRRKKLLTVGGTGPWAVTIDTTGTASDGTYLPVTGRAVCPWTDALADVAKAVGEHVAKTGPGQCVEYDPGDGFRQMRVPLASSGEYPTTIGQKVGVDIANAVPAVSGAALVSASPASITVEGLDLVNLYRLTDLGIYAQ